MKITKETIERLIEGVKDYDQDTGIHEIKLILNPSCIDLLREYYIYIHTKESLVEINIDLFNYEDSIRVSVSIENGRYYNEFGSSRTNWGTVFFTKFSKNISLSCCEERKRFVN